MIAFVATHLENLDWSKNMYSRSRLIHVQPLLMQECSGWAVYSRFYTTHTHTNKNSYHSLCSCYYKNIFLALRRQTLLSVYHYLLGHHPKRGASFGGGRWGRGQGYPFSPPLMSTLTNCFAKSREVSSGTSAGGAWENGVG